MYQVIKIGFLVSVLCASSNALAGEYYFGGKLANVNPAIDGLDINTSRSFSYQNVSTIGAVMGLKLDDNLSIEGDISTNVSSGKIDNTSGDNNLKWNITTLSVHGLYKSNGSIHAIIKAGLTGIMLSDPSSFSANSWYPENSSVNFSYGAGVGFNTSSGKEVVVEWIQLSERFTSINFGINF